MLEHIQADWNLLKDKHEREIIKSYTKLARLFTVIAICKKSPVSYISCITFCKITNYYSLSKILILILLEIFL